MKKKIQNHIQVGQPTALKNQELAQLGVENVPIKKVGEVGSMLLAC